MLALAGACHFVAMSHGPARYRNIDISTLPSERREAVDDTLRRDLSAAIEFLGWLTMLVTDEKFDEQFATPVDAIVADHDGGRSVQFIKGYKPHA
jgi:hypothetical protein